MSCKSNESQNAVSPIICPDGGGRIREGGENRGINSDSDLRPKGSNPGDSTGDQDNQKQNREEGQIEEQESEESDIVIPESNKIPNTPSLEDYTKHQVTQYPFQAWCPK